MTLYDFNSDTLALLHEFMIRHGYNSLKMDSGHVQCQDANK